MITYTVTGFVNGETKANAYTGAPTLDTPTTPVGSYPVFTPGLGTLSATNYTFDIRSATLTVTPAQLTVAADDANAPLRRRQSHADLHDHRLRQR